VKRLRLDARRYRSIRLSPDGSRLAAEVQEPGKGRDLWVYDLASGTPTRLTSDGHDGDPVWSPDGRQIAFTRRPQGTITADVYVVPSDGSGSPRLLAGGPGGQRVRGWNPDGTLVIDDDGGGVRAPGIFAMKIGQAPQELLSSSAYVASKAAPSPDGRWLAFTSNESGALQVFVRPFGGGGKQQLSTDGGSQPAWSRDGRTLYYRDRGQIVAVSITANGAAPIIGARRVAFGDSLGRSNIVDFAAHGERELLIAQSTWDGEQIVVVVNWLEEVKRRLMAPGQR
jgi:Tol biopolymer transport system component